MNGSGGAHLFGKGIAFPPRVGGDGRVAWSEGETNIREAVEIILKTAPGERLRLPSFGGGLDRFLFEPNAPSTHHQIEELVGRALATWEPRVRVESVRVEEDPGDGEAAVATIAYKLVATQIVQTVSVSVPLRG
jgi:hypothetical protein